MPNDMAGTLGAAHVSFNGRFDRQPPRPTYVNDIRSECRTMPDNAPVSVSISPSAARRIAALKASEGNSAMMLRVTVLGGGCSGFKYTFDLDAAVNPDDHVFERDGAKVVVDPVSMDFLGSAEVDYREDLMGSYFTIANPNAKSSCGCGASFSVD
jgi:iron-sulfur cluster insertion protein